MLNVSGVCFCGFHSEKKKLTQKLLVFQDTRTEAELLWTAAIQIHANFYNITRSRPPGLVLVSMRIQPYRYNYSLITLPRLRLSHRNLGREVGVTS